MTEMPEANDVERPDQDEPPKPHQEEASDELMSEEARKRIAESEPADEQ